MQPGPGPGTVEVGLRSGGVDRTFLLHEPASPGAEALPTLLLVFHGRYGTAAGLEAQSGFSELADREGFIAVYPQGEGRRWDDGRSGGSMDDVNFVCAILDTLDSLSPYDHGRVFATGMSNGAFFCNWLAGNRPDLVLAIAPVAGGMADPWPGGFDPAGSVSVLMVNGTADPLVPWGGGAIGYEDGRRGQGSMIPVMDAFLLWGDENGCTGPMDSLDMPDIDPSDGCTCTRFDLQPGEGGSRVGLIRVEGGGHTWPGLDDGLRDRLTGATCMDFPSPEVIWEFFESIGASLP